MKNKSVMTAVFAAGLAVVAWVGWGFVGSSPMALAMTGVIAAVYLLGAWEVWQFRAATGTLQSALATVDGVDGVADTTVQDLQAWLGRLAPSLRHPTRLRIEGERSALPGPALAPYLVGLLVMLGMLGTFLGMVVTFKGAVFALETSSNLEAIRAALAAPIKGLGLSFGTSVAGVAASAMLGLMLATARRERVEAVRHLDGLVPTVFKPFSSAHRREAMFQALQTQAETMPQIADRLQRLVDGLEQRHGELQVQLLAQQQGFHTEASAAYKQLAGSVGTSLHESLMASAQQAGEAIRPVVEQAMSTLTDEAERSHQRLRDATQTHMQGLTVQWEGSARQVADTWTAALGDQARTHEALVGRLDGALQHTTQAFDQRSAALVAAMRDATVQAQAAQVAADGQRLERWGQSIEAMSSALAGQWQRAGEQAAERHATVSAALETAVGQVEQSLQATTHAFEQRSAALLTSLQYTVAQSHTAQLAADQARQEGWNHALQRLTGTLAGEWQRLGAEVAEQQRGVSEALQGAAAQLDKGLATASQAFDQRATALLEALQDTVAQSHAAQLAADQQRQEGWNQSMQGLAGTLSAEWQRVGDHGVQQQRAVVSALEGAASQIAERLTEQVARTLGSASALMEQSDVLMRERIAGEERWVQAQGQRLAEMAQVWRTELAALRDAEASRGEAAVQRLDALQGAVAQHLATLGAALEAPLTRLLQTASDVPQAAAEVITQLRQEMTRLSERDNIALEERTAMTEQLGSLLQSVSDSASQQRAAIDTLVASASETLEQAGQQFAQALGTQAGKADDVAAHVAASAVELAALGEAFNHGVELFSASNDKLVQSLQGIEGAIGQSLSRSDEQLAYYVAQAREVIDLSISSQQGIVEDLRRLHGKASSERGVAA